MADRTSRTALTLSGRSIAGSVAEGRAFLLREINLEALIGNRFPVDDPAMEIARLEGAVEKSAGQILQIVETAGTQPGAGIRDIFQAQVTLLQDPIFQAEIKNAVRRERVNVEHVLASRISAIQKAFLALNDEAMCARSHDIQDVYHRLLRNLLNIEHVRANPARRLEGPVIFIAEHLLPSDLALLDFKNILGLIVEEGSVVSHVAIISKSLGIPAVSGIRGVYALIRNGDALIVDGDNGRVILHPTTADLACCHQKQKKSASGAVPGRAAIAGQTADGIAVRLEANVGSLREALGATESGAEGVGLLRTEFFYLISQHLPAAEAETAYYRDILRTLGNRPVTFRLLDLGADKLPPYFPALNEENPQLGCRGVRYLLRHPDLFHAHLCRLFSAAENRPIRLLVPFVTLPEDMERAREAIEKACLKTGTNRGSFEVGAMIEIPSAALLVKEIAVKSDFLSLGTNDLVQYLFAVNRDDINLDAYRRSLHPIMLTLIRQAVAAASAAGIPLSVCGEMASDPMIAGILVGLGVRALSIHPDRLPEIRQHLKTRTVQSFEADVAHLFPREE